MKLIYEKTGKPVKSGDQVLTFRGEQLTVRSIEKPRHAGSTGRVYTESEEGFKDAYFPSVIGAKWVEE